MIQVICPHCGSLDVVCKIDSALGSSLICTDCKALTSTHKVNNILELLKIEYDWVQEYKDWDKAIQNVQNKASQLILKGEAALNELRPLMTYMDCYNSGGRDQTLYDAMIRRSSNVE